MSDLYQLTVNDHNNQPTSLSQFKDKVLLIVNTASKCGFTYQYEALESLHEKYHQQGLAILAFPCNQFGQQEPGDNNEIQSFCQLNYKTQFPVFAKVDVNGPNAHPLYQYLTNTKRGLLGSKKIKWNFTKFIIDKQGEIVGRFGPVTKPEALEKTIVKLLNQ